MASMDWKNYLRGINLDSTSYCNAKCAAVVEMMTITIMRNNHGCH